MPNPAKALASSSAPAPPPASAPSLAPTAAPAVEPVSESKLPWADVAAESESAAQTAPGPLVSNAVTGFGWAGWVEASVGMV